jgi:hypothetical protein
MAAAACGMLLSTATLSANDPVLEWNAIMVSTTAGQNPFFQVRFAAITQLAVFEAVNAIDKDFDPYLGTIAAPPTASAEAAAVAAAHGVLKNYFPANASALDAARATSLAGIADGIPKQEGIAVGEAAAAAMAPRRPSSTCPHLRIRASGSRRRAVHRRAASCCNGGICAHLRSRPQTGSAPRRRLRSQVGATRATITR